ARRLDAVDLHPVGPRARALRPGDRKGTGDDRPLGPPADLERREDDGPGLQGCAGELDGPGDRDPRPEAVRLAAAGPQAPEREPEAEAEAEPDDCADPGPGVHLVARCGVVRGARFQRPQSGVPGTSETCPTCHSSV